jgi:hypothetical protein
VGKNTPPRIKRFPVAKQRRLDELLDRNAEGTITPKQKAALEQLVAEAEELMVYNLKRLAEFSKSQSPAPPPNAVPVTVWVSPQSVH